mmetsp:Transcript_3692/g.7899  ORF Transcript_3692/g.7899 Transcript_3692/m.7899 type:complete len:245 (+) Transcript_3692:684-1418(+)
MTSPPRLSTGCMSAACASQMPSSRSSIFCAMPVPSSQCCSQSLRASPSWRLARRSTWSLSCAGTRTRRTACACLPSRRRSPRSTGTQRRACRRGSATCTRTRVICATSATATCRRRLARRSLTVRICFTAIWVRFPRRTCARLTRRRCATSCTFLCSRATSCSWTTTRSCTAAQSSRASGCTPSPGSSRGRSRCRQVGTGMEEPSGCSDAWVRMRGFGVPARARVSDAARTLFMLDRPIITSFR